MIIPTLVLVTAMQFGDPQSGAKIDDLTLSPWRDIPASNATTHTAAYASPSDAAQDVPAVASDLAQTIAPTVAPTMPSTQLTTPMTVPPTAGTGGFGLGVRDPDLNGNGIVDPMPIPLQTNTYTPPAPTPIIPQSTATRPTANGASGTGRYMIIAGGGSDYSGPTRVENNKVHISRAKVEFDKIARLSAPVGGIVLELKTPKCDIHGNVQKASNGEPIKIELQRGVLLFTGQQVAQLDDRYPSAQYSVAVTKLAVANKEAEQEIGIKYAKAQLNTATSDWNRHYDIATRSPGAVTKAELEVKEFQLIEAGLQLEKATIDHEIQQESVKVQQEEVNVAQTQMDLRKVKTPFNAIVVNVLTQVGNYLKEGDPVAEVAQFDKLKIVANVDGKQVTQEQVDGKRVTIRADYPGGRTEEFEGFVRYAAPIFSDNLRNFEVEIEVDNRLVENSWLLKQGDYVDVVIHLN